MVSTKIINDLKTSYMQMQEHRVDISRYTDTPTMHDIVFNLFSINSSIAGVASKIIDAQVADVITETDKEILGTPLLFNGCFWRTIDGKLIDLTPFPDILTEATITEKIRQICVSLVAVVPPQK